MFESLFGHSLKNTMVTKDRALPGRDASPSAIPLAHAVLPSSLTGPFPADAHTIYLGLGCFWGAEKEFWQTPGVISTAVGYQGGYTPNPTYEEVCTGQTGHTEVVKVVYHPAIITDTEILAKFWESHDPTQGFRQGNDAGTQYRSAVYVTSPEQAVAAQRTLESFQRSLSERGYGAITTEIRPVSAELSATNLENADADSSGAEPSTADAGSAGLVGSPAGPFFYAEGYHQQYLQKNPNGYCPIHSTGVACAVSE